MNVMGGLGDFRGRWLVFAINHRVAASSVKGCKGTDESVVEKRRLNRVLSCGEPIR